MTVRCKMRLSGVEKYETGNTWYTHKKGVQGNAGNMNVADLEFYVVSGGNPENDVFFASTPTGSMKFSVVNQEAIDELLQNIGKEFYVDITVAPGQEEYKPTITKRIKEQV